MWEFQLRNLEDLRQLNTGLGVLVEAIEDISILAEPVHIPVPGTRGPGHRLYIPNSLAVHPMEGCDADARGGPGELTFRRYERFAAGGAGLIWVEATAVVPEGRANPRQLWLNEHSADSFASLLSMVRQTAAGSSRPRHRPLVVLQLTHSGRYSKPVPLPAARNPYLQSPGPSGQPPVVTDEYLAELVNAYVKAARLAFQAGFDAVDIKACHGYLINELLACRTRGGRYGGTFENRTRFFLEVIDQIRARLGQDKPIATRLGVYDCVPYPFGWAVHKDDWSKPDLTEPKRLIALLRQRGVRLLNITAGNPYYNPHIGRPFNQPTVGGYEQGPHFAYYRKMGTQPEHPLVGVARLINLAAEIQKQFPDMTTVGTGYSWLRGLFANVAAASKAKGLTTLIGVGRMAFAYPDFARDIMARGRLDPRKVCVGCSGCTQIMRDGGMTGCVVRDNKVYGPIFKQGRLSDRDNLVRLGQACRRCQEPTCQRACPAGVDIPRFISLFLDGDEKAAYEVLREANIFPEICAWLCPVEHQCEGNCLQSFIGDGPLPIAAIQRYVSEQASKKGWSKLRIPSKARGKKVAVIGAGPAGLACAAKLLEAGYTVTVFDKRGGLGGMIDSVIPPVRYSNSLNREMAAVFSEVPQERFIKRLGTELNAVLNLDAVMAEGFDAAFIGLGLAESVSIGDSKIDGLWNAMDFLSAAKQPGMLDVQDKQVAVIGGGNTAMDVAVTAKRLGAKDVYVIYRRSFAEMPAWGTERERALNEAIHLLVLTQMLEVITTDKRLTGIKVCPTRLGEPDQTGRRRPKPLPASAYELDMDMVVEAIGQKSPTELNKILPGVQLEEGLIKTREDSLASSRPGVFAGGDLVRGPSTVVAAVADGMTAAKQIDEYLNKSETY